MRLPITPMRTSFGDEEQNISERSILLDGGESQENLELQMEILSKYSTHFRIIGIFQVAVGTSGFITLLLYSLFAEKQSRFEGYVVYFGIISCVLFAISGMLATSLSTKPSKLKIMSGIVLGCVNLVSEIAIMVVLIHYIIYYNPRDHEYERIKNGMLYLATAWIAYEIVRSALAGLQIFFSLDASFF